MRFTEAKKNEYENIQIISDRQHRYKFVFQPLRQIDGFVNAFYRGLKKK